MGGAVLSLGAQVTVEAGTAFRNNSAVGCNYGAFGGAIASTLSRLSVSGSTFSGNSARDSQSCSGVTKYAFGGGLYILRPLATAVVHATLFESNVASGGRLSIGGAIRLHANAHLTLRASVLRQNVAQNGREALGGAIGLEAASAVLSATNTSFEHNAARSGRLHSRGGALYVEKGRAEIGQAVVFRSNVVSSGSIIDGAVGGGAIALTQAASLNAQEAPVFEANEATGTEPRGGALFVDASSAVIGSGVFEGNIVTVLTDSGYGGASPSRPQHRQPRVHGR
jgi:putative intracellular protease/amidase